jgi:hypothetical protein
MPDTGAPWNIPFAEGSDLVRDWPALSEDVADAVAAGLSASAIIKQVVQTVKTDTFTTTSATYTALTGMSVTLTTASATNKVLVVANVTGANSSNASANFRLMRGATVLAVGDTAGDRIRAFSGWLGSGASGYATENVTMVFLDSPGAAASTTYSVEVSRGGVTSTTVCVNRTGVDTDSTDHSRYVSSITAIEVLA